MNIKIAQSKGTVVYGTRAFHQDAMLAMKNDIVRGIIEMITNCDDAYVSIKDDQQKKIIIEVERRMKKSWKVVVKDRATGMSISDLISRITRLGERTSGFEKGEDKRGNLGRGAKDLAAFGQVLFETIRDNRISRLLLKNTGEWMTVDSKGKEVNHDTRVTPDDRQALGIKRGNGTVVTVTVSPKISCPREETLRRNLSGHFQLRDILSDPLRRVELVNLNDGTRELLKYEFPPSRIVFDKDIAVEGYPEAKVHLTIKRLNQRYDIPSYDATRPNGILVKGKRAIYENTLFNHENEMHSGWFTGELSAPYVDKQAREYDDDLDKGKEHHSSNPMPIISRNRDGLNGEHPFVKALFTAADKELGKYIKIERDKAAGAQLGDAQTQKDLDKLAKELGKIINDELKEIEAEELPPEDGKLPPALTIIPQLCYVFLGEIRTLTVVANSSTSVQGQIVDITVEPEGIIELMTPEVILGAHSSRDDVLVGQIHLNPIRKGEAVLITARLGENEAQALAEVRSSRVIVEEEIEPPDTLQFERPSYRIGWQKRKTISLQAPAEFVAKYGESVKIASSDPGVIVKTPSVDLAFNDDMDFYTCQVTLEGRQLDATSTVSAQAGQQIASTKIIVKRTEQEPGVKIILSPDQPGHWRAIHDVENKGTDKERKVLKVFVNHAAIQPFFETLGPNHSLTRALISEAVADVSARIIVETLYQKRRGLEDFDAARFYGEHYRRLARILPRVYRIMVGSPTTLDKSLLLEPSPLIEVTS